MIILFCLLVASFVFFTSFYILENIKHIEIAGKVQNAVERRKDRSFIITFVMDSAEKFGRFVALIKYKKFVVLMDKIGVVLKSLGGKHEKINPHQFFSLQIFAMVAGAFIAFTFISSNIFVVVLSGGFFFLLPLLKIKEQSKRRKEIIAKQLPDMADLLSIMLNVGLDFYGAAGKVIHIMKGPLADEFKDVLSKISLGYDKQLALTEMARKIGVEQLSFFVRTINMSLESGTGMADALKRLAVSLRNERFSYAEKKAHEVPVKILIPLVLLIFPTIFIVVFGPIIINFIVN